MFKVVIEPEFKDIISTLPPEKQTEVMKGILFYPEYNVEDCKAWVVIKYMLDKQNQKQVDKSNKARAAVKKRWDEYRALKLGKVTETITNDIVTHTTKVADTVPTNSTLQKVQSTPSTNENKDATIIADEKPEHIPDGDDKVIVTIPKHVLTKTKEQVISEWKKIEYAGDCLTEECRDIFQISTFIKKIDKWVSLHNYYPLKEYDIWPDINLTKGNLNYLLVSLKQGLDVPVRKIGE